MERGREHRMKVGSLGWREGGSTRKERESRMEREREHRMKEGSTGWREGGSI